jgi:peptidyl-dipeptidase A
MLQLGSSKPWPDAMEALTGQKEILVTSIKTYFQPLMDWLQEENEKNGETIGWTDVINWEEEN